MHHATTSLVFLLNDIELLFANAGCIIDFYITSLLEEITCCFTVNYVTF